MSRNIVSTILTLIFLLFIAAPTIITIVDDTVDVSVFYTSTSSEEEENSSQKSKEVNVLVFVIKENEPYIVNNNIENNSGYSFKNYPKVHLNLISPPPDLSLI